MADRPSAAAADRDPVVQDDLTEEAAVRLEVFRGALLDSAGLDKIAAPAPVIDGLLYSDGIAWLYGKPGTYKSVLALDWACCVSTGLPWLDRETAEGPVLYLCAEGVGGLRARVRAWEARAGCAAKVMFLPVAVQVAKGTDLQAFTALVGELKPALVIVDTQARATVGVEENSATAMGLVVVALAEIIRVGRACLLLVHHEGRSGENPRGSIAIEGSAASLFRAEYDGVKVRLVNRRQRDTVEADVITLWPVSSNSSVVLSGTRPQGVTRENALSGTEVEILRFFREVAPEYGASASMIIRALNRAESTVYAGLKSLVRQGLVVSSGTRHRSHYELPGSPLCPVPYSGRGTGVQPGNGLRAPLILRSLRPARPEYLTSAFTACTGIYRSTPVGIGRSTPVLRPPY